MSNATSDSFTDTAGRVFIDGQQEPRLHVVAWEHATGCRLPTYRQIARTEYGRTFCDCLGRALLAWVEVPGL